MQYGNLFESILHFHSRNWYVKFYTTYLDLPCVEHIQAPKKHQGCKFAGVSVKFYYLDLPCVKQIQEGNEGKCCKLAGVYVPFPFVCVSFNLSFNKHIQVGNEGKCCKLAGVYVPFPFLCDLSFKKKQRKLVYKLTAKYIAEN